MLGCFSSFSSEISRIAVLGTPSDSLWQRQAVLHPIIQGDPQPNGALCPFLLPLYPKGAFEFGVGLGEAGGDGVVGKEREGMT